MRKTLFGIVRITVVVGTWLIGAAEVHASIVYSDFGSGDAYDTGPGWFVSGSTSAQTVGAEFAMSSDVSVTQIDVALQHISGTNSAVVSLWTTSGTAPGTELASWSVSNQPVAQGAPNPLTSVTNISGVNLVAGSNYFLVVAPGASDTFDSWSWVSPSVQSAIWLNSPSGANLQVSASPAFDIQGTSPVPLPATAWLMLSGLGGLGFFFRRHV